MKKTILFTATFAAAAIFVALVGCETEKLSDTQLAISPAKATIAPGQDLVLKAEGGWDYTWDIDPKYGTLSTYNGKQVTYSAPAKDPNSTSGVHQTVTVQVHSASNHTASAVITIHADGETTSESSQSASSNSSSGSSSSNPASDSDDD